MSVPTHIKEHAILGVKSNAATDHGGLSGLADDDHTQYLLANGTRALSGNWSVGADIIPSSNDTYHLGSSTVRFNAVYASSFMFGTTVMLNGGTTNMSTGLNLVPSTDGGKNLGASDQRFNTLYLSANLSDGTNTLTIANAKTAYDFSQDATLISIALLGTAADKMLYTTGIDTWAEASLTAAGRALLDDANTAAQIATLGLDADLATFSLPASTTISTFGASLIDDAAASNAIATLGLDADIATLSLPASTTITAAAATILDDTTVGAIRTTLGVGTGDSPAFAGLAVSGTGAAAVATFLNSYATGDYKQGITIGDSSGNTYTIARRNTGFLSFTGTQTGYIGYVFDQNVTTAGIKTPLYAGAAGTAAGDFLQDPASTGPTQTAQAQSIRVGYQTTSQYTIGRNTSTGYLDFIGSQTGYIGYNFDSLVNIKQKSGDGYLCGLNLVRAAAANAWALVTGGDNALYFGYGANGVNFTGMFAIAAAGQITSTKSVTHQIGNLQISDDGTYCSLTRVA